MVPFSPADKDNGALRRKNRRRRDRGAVRDRPYVAIRRTIRPADVSGPAIGASRATDGSPVAGPFDAARASISSRYPSSAGYEAPWSKTHLDNRFSAVRRISLRSILMNGATPVPAATVTRSRESWLPMVSSIVNWPAALARNKTVTNLERPEQMCEWVSPMTGWRRIVELERTVRFWRRGDRHGSTNRAKVRPFSVVEPEHAACCPAVNHGRRRKTGQVGSGAVASASVRSVRRSTVARYASVRPFQRNADTSCVSRSEPYLVYFLLDPYCSSFL